MLLLSSCSVYVPMQGAAPEIRGKGELEAIGSWSLTNRFELGATYSPLPHLLVRAAASTKSSRPAPTDTTTHAWNSQYELGLGTYWPLGPHWLIGGLASFGQAHALARYQEDGATFIHFSPLIQHQFDATYHKYAAEAYLTWQPSPQVSAGFAYRLVQLHLTDVTDLGQPVPATSISRYEPMLFFRVRPGASELFQLQVACGVSGTFGYDERSAADRADPARQFKLSRGYTSLGFAIYPHVLWRKK